MFHARRIAVARALAKRRAARQAGFVPSPSVVPRPAAHTWLACALLAAGTFLLFSRALPYGFINYDDTSFVVQNPHVQAGLTWDGLVWAFTGRTDYWRPLTWLSHMLDWQLFGDRAGGHRAVNMAWHAINAALAFLLCRRLLAGWWSALFCAALFAWHPLRVESVVWVSERKDVLAGCFFLLTLLAYHRHAERVRTGAPARRTYALMLALCLGGLMCKPTLVALPVVLLALDTWPLARLSWRRAPGWWAAHRCVLLEKLPFILLSAVISVVTIHMQAKADAFTLAVPLDERIGNALVSIARYLGNVAWPLDLAFFYEHPGAWPRPAVAGALALVLAVTALTWIRRERTPSLLAGWIWFLSLLLPTLGVLQVGLQAMADRYTYLPVLGLQLAVLPWVTARLAPAALKTGLAAAVLAECAGVTWWQQGFWRDSETLYRRAIAMDPTSANAEAFLGYTLHQAGRNVEAEHHARRALELSPDNHWGWLTLANVQGETGRLAEAVEAYQRLVTMDPAYARGHYLRGLLLVQLGRLEEAEAGLVRAAELLPESAQTRLVLAEVQARRRHFAEAAESYRAVIALQPRSAEAHAGLGYMLALTGDRDGAARHWTEALRLNPDFPGLRERLERLRP
jgi:Flp pilus assembly protein TadD